MKIAREKIFSQQSAIFVGVTTILQNNVSKVSERRRKQLVRLVIWTTERTENTPHKCFRCGSEDHIIDKCPNPPKKNDKRKTQVHFSERGNRASQKECYNGDNNNDQKIYESMALMSGNDESRSRYFGDSSKLTNCILDSGATCNMTPQVSDFIPG